MSMREIPIDEPEDNVTDDGGRAASADTESGDQEGTGAGTPNAETDTPQRADDPVVGDEARIAALEADVARLRDQALRAVADLENFRRRAQAERIQLIEYANERLLRELLPMVDDLHRSVESGAQSTDYQSFYQGVVMISDKVRKLLEAQGVTRIETVGQPFDVNLHEALMRQPSDAPEDSVISELEPGYKFGDRVLRHAKVIVSAGS